MGRRMNRREYENMPEINSVMVKEDRVFSTTLDIRDTICNRENKATYESGVIAEYLKVLQLEDAET